MASNTSTTTVYTARDTEILTALYYNPLTAEQILTISETFHQPYTNLDYLRRRLQKLSDAGWVRSWRYATTSRGALRYYKLTRGGFRLLHGAEIPLPAKGYFRLIGPSRHEHTRRLADVIVHTHVAAHTHQLRLASKRYENQVTLKIGEDSQKPDFCLQVIAPTGRAFNCLIELDNGTEPVFSLEQRESIRRKIAFHERLQNKILPNRFDVSRRYRLLFFTQTWERAYNILSLAAELATNKDRRLCYATTVADYVGEIDALRQPIFLDHHGQWQSVLNLHPTSYFLRSRVRLPKLLEGLVPV